MIKNSNCNKRAASGDFTWPLIRWQNVTRIKLYFACYLQLFPWGQELALETAVTFPNRVWEERRLLECDRTALLQLFGFIFPIVPWASLAIINTHLEEIKLIRIYLTSKVRKHMPRTYSRESVWEQMVRNRKSAFLAHSFVLSVTFGAQSWVWILEWLILKFPIDTGTYLQKDTKLPS